MSTSNSSLLVAGIGSYFSTDDEIGLVLVKAFNERCSQGRVDTILWEDADALTLASELLNLTMPVLLVDCADMRLPGGEWRLFSEESIRQSPTLSALSTHGLGVAEALNIARELGAGQPVHFFGIQPFDLSPQRGLSINMQACLPALQTALVSVVNEAILL